MENAMRNNKFTQCRKYLESGRLLFTLVTVMGAAVSPLAASAQNKKDEISFDLVADPKFVDCLRKSSYEEPRARATVIRGKLNDTMILDLDGFKPGLAFDLFTVQRSPFLSDKTPDPNFKGSFGLAWYQSEIAIGKQTDDGHVRIKTILLDQIFGFDPERIPATHQHLPRRVLVQQSARRCCLRFSSGRPHQVHSVQWRTQGGTLRDDQCAGSDNAVGATLHRS
jgi:hypothetical protein